MDMSLKFFKNHNNFKITGSIIQAYLICPRQAWLMSRKISGDQSNTSIEIGRIIDENTYSREKKEIRFGSNIFDIVKNEDGKIKIIEVKKSSKMIESAKMQILYYLYLMNFDAEAEIRIPKEKKIIKVYMDENNKGKIESTLKNIEELLTQEKTPSPVKVKYCKTCSYFEFCWA